MWNWFSPKGIVFGEGKAASTGLFARQWGRGRALVITGPFLRRSGVVEPVLQSLREEGLLGAVFSDIPSEPTDRHVREALGLFRRERCGTIVACGGGGPIDVAKAVSLLDANGGAVRDYAGVGRVPHPGVPIIAIPTTAGSGSEVSGTTIITEEAAHEKLLVISMYLVPEIAILDPLLTYGMPPALTAATGVDALTHAIESCVSRKATKLTIDFSLRAAGRLARFLPVAFASPDDAEARRECLLGSLEAGIAFTNSSVALVHGMARPLGAKFGIPHGVSNAVLLEAIMRFSLPGAQERYARLNVCAPIDGQLSDLNVEIGQVVGAGSQIGKINVLNDYKVMTQIDEHYIDRVRKGLTATLERQGKDFQMGVIKVYPDVKDGQFKTDLEFTTTVPPNIRTGQTYHLNLQLGAADESILIPRGTFYQSTGGQWIYVLSPDGTEAFRRKIKIGKQNPRYYQVTEGLQPGEKIITSGYEMFGG